MDKVTLELGKGIAPGDPESHRSSEVLSVIALTLDILAKADPSCRNMVQTMKAVIGKKTEIFPIPFYRYLRVDFIILFSPPITSAKVPSNLTEINKIGVVARWKGGRHNTMTAYHLAYVHGISSASLSPFIGGKIFYSKLRSKEIGVLASTLVEIIRIGINKRREFLEFVRKDLETTEKLIEQNNYKPQKLC